MPIEPTYVLKDELQAYARIQRISQKNPRTYTYRFVNKDSAIEKKIIERQILRRRTINRSFKVVPDPANSGSGVTLLANSKRLTTVNDGLSIICSRTRRERVEADKRAAEDDSDENGEEDSQLYFRREDCVLG